MSVIPKRNVGYEISLLDMISYGINVEDPIMEYIRKAQEWDLIPRDNEIKCPTSGCPGYLVMGPDKSRIDENLWHCYTKYKDKHKKTVHCTYRFFI